jgi:hypothetical protein
MPVQIFITATMGRSTPESLTSRFCDDLDPLSSMEAGGSFFAGGNAGREMDGNAEDARIYID